jgi:hypothetical protein
MRRGMRSMSGTVVTNWATVKPYLCFAAARARPRPSRVRTAHSQSIGRLTKNYTCGSLRASTRNQMGAVFLLAAGSIEGLEPPSRRSVRVVEGVEVLWMRARPIEPSRAIAAGAVPASGTYRPRLGLKLGVLWG